MNVQAPEAVEVEVRAYQHHYEHLVDELRKLDLLIQRRVLAFRLEREIPQQPATGQQQIYVSHEEVDWLLDRDDGAVVQHDALNSLDEQIQALDDCIGAATVSSRDQGIILPLVQLARLFSLSSGELQAIIICLAPELRRKYDRLYAYLQDDITRKKPSVDLILDLLCRTEPKRWQVRTLFTESGTLLRTGLLQPSEDAQSQSGSSGLARFLKLDPRIVDFLLGNNSVDSRLQTLVTVWNPSETLPALFIDSAIKDGLMGWVEQRLDPERSGGKKPLVYLQGPYGVGKRDLALSVCEHLGCSLLSLDLEMILNQAEQPDELLRLAFREGLLLQAALYLENVDRLLQDEVRANAFGKTLERLIVEYGWLSFLVGDEKWSPHGLFRDVLFHRVELPVPDVPLREAAWQAEGLVPGSEANWTAHLATQYRLTPGQIRDAVAWIEDQRAAGKLGQSITLEELSTACRNQSNHKLGELATKIEPQYGWDDIVLPEDKLMQLREICSQVKYSYQVFEDWGFTHKLSHGKGLSALFTGQPGTGKTMAAEVVANELSLDLYKIDLSSVVSKYIGETEQNLGRIFHEAETSNAILFFDEADALFGRRTQISDAHDRYANIETSYLLQKMEEYEGVVIMATNLRENMDEAFARRLRFIVELPFPNEESRLRIWKSHFPSRTPVDDSIDYQHFAREFQITGGSIKNIVLNAAFLAAEDGSAVETGHLLNAAKREYEKIGRLWSDDY